MKLTSQSFKDGGAIPGRCAFAVPDPASHVRLSDNRNPELSWSGAPAGSHQGVNDYTGWFAGDKDMAGTYLGYDGPCPPWNDELPHHYRFELHALDLERCPVRDPFTVADVRKAIAGHSLAQASITGLYSLNPAVQVP